MRLLNYFIILATSTMLMSPVSFADTTKHPHASIVFQVVQDQMNIDNSMIKDASLIDNNGTYGGLKIILNTSDSKELTQITKAGVGKIANLVINNKIVTSATLRSSLQHQFLVLDITKEDAQAFIDSVKKS